MFDRYGKIISEKSMRVIHGKALEVLERVGLRVLYEGYYPSLEASGAVVDRGSGVVKFPPKLVESAIEETRRKLGAGKRQLLLNGVTNPKTRGMQFKFAGACIEYLDPFSNTVREPTDSDLVRLIQFGQGTAEVTFVGNPVCFLKDRDGRRVPGPLQRILTAALVATHTTKYGSNEVWNEEELELLIELGSIVRGGEAGYFANPCFVTAKETISPLIFPEDDGRVLLMLAKRGLPCTVIPMPISGATCPVTAASNIVMTCAEVLGVMCCILCAAPDAVVGGGAISGVMDMRRGSVSFAAPEAILQDLGAAALFEELYGQDFAVGTGYIDAAVPGAQSAAEIYAKMAGAHAIGHDYHPVGLLAGGKRWSPVQAIMGMELAQYLHRSDAEIRAEEEDIPVELFERVGIGGNYLAEEHTAANFRKSIWMPELMDRALTSDIDADRMIENAKQKWSDFLKKDAVSPVGEDVQKEIEKWKLRAIKILMK